MNPRLFTAATQTSKPLETCKRIHPEGPQEEFLKLLTSNDLPMMFHQMYVRLGNGDWAVAHVSEGKTNIYIFDAGSYQIKKILNAACHFFLQLNVSSAGNLIAFYKKSLTGSWNVELFDDQYKIMRTWEVRKGDKEDSVPDYLIRQHFVKATFAEQHVDNIQYAKTYSLANNQLAILIPDLNYLVLINLNEPGIHKTIKLNLFPQLVDLDTNSVRFVGLKNCSSHNVITVAGGNGIFTNIKGLQPIAFDIEKEKLYSVEASYAISQVFRISDSYFATMEYPKFPVSSLLRIFLLDDELVEVNRFELGPKFKIKTNFPSVTGLLLLENNKNELLICDPFKVDTRPQKLDIKIRHISSIEGSLIAFNKLFVKYKSEFAKEPRGTLLEFEGLSEYYQLQSQQPHAATTAAVESKEVTGDTASVGLRN